MPTTIQRRALPAVVHGLFRASPYVVSTRQADSTVLLDARHGLYYSLNELGWRIWEQIGAGEPVTTVIRTLRQEYDVAPESFDADVAAFVDHLLRASLIEPVTG